MDEDNSGYWVSFPRYSYLLSPNATGDSYCVFTIEAIVHIDVDNSEPVKLIMRVVHRLANFGAKPLLQDLTTLAADSFLLMSGEFNRRNPLDGSPGETLFLPPEPTDLAAGLSGALASAYPG